MASCFMLSIPSTARPYILYDCLSSFLTIFACPFSSNEQPSHKYNFRETQHRLWLEREAIAQERFRKKTEDEARKLREKQEQEVRFIIALFLWSPNIDHLPWLDRQRKESINLD